MDAQRKAYEAFIKTHGMNLFSRDDETIARRSFEAGYTRGYQARPERVSFPLAGQRDFVRLLGAYLAEGIDIYHPFSGRYGRLLGLPATYEHDEPVADVQFYCDAEAQAEGCGDVLEPFGKLLPVLYGFEDLASEMLLPDGRRGVPAVEVAKRWHSDIKTAKIIENYEGGGLTCVCKGPGCELSISKRGFEQNTLGAWLIEPLRHYHFAVGLAPEQYPRRVVGFDYRQGAKPDALAGKEATRA